MVVFMRSRQEIKAHAKQMFIAQRSPSILAPFLVLLIGGVLGAVAMIPGIGWLLSIAGTFLVMVLDVNLSGLFIKVYYGQPITPTEHFNELKTNFFRKLGGMYWMALWFFLWYLCFFVPGIIKLLAYSMTPYILANHPNVQATDAIKLSMRMTKGHKGKIFMLFLSFIGWQLLNGLTFGILGILYVNPYMNTSFAGFFVELRNLALTNGVINQSELDGGMPQYASPPQQPPPPAFGGPQPQFPPAPPHLAPPFGAPMQPPAAPPPPPAPPYEAPPPHQPPAAPPPPPPQYAAPPPPPQQPPAPAFDEPQFPPVAPHLAPPFGAPMQPPAPPAPPYGAPAPQQAPPPQQPLPQSPPIPESPPVPEPPKPPFEG